MCQGLDSSSAAVLTVDGLSSVFTEQSEKSWSPKVQLPEPALSPSNITEGVVESAQYFLYQCCHVLPCNGMAP